MGLVRGAEFVLTQSLSFIGYPYIFIPLSIVLTSIADRFEAPSTTPRSAGRCIWRSRALPPWLPSQSECVGRESCFEGTRCRKCSLDLHWEWRPPSASRPRADPKLLSPLSDNQNMGIYGTRSREEAARNYYGGGTSWDVAVQREARLAGRAARAAEYQRQVNGREEYIHRNTENSQQARFLRMTPVYDGRLMDRAQREAQERVRSHYGV